MNLSSSIRDLNAAASGAKKASLIITGCRLLSVYTGEEIEGAQIAVYGDRVAYVGPDASHARGPRTRMMDARGRYAGPGMADPHTHIDQFASPREFARRALLSGVTSVFSDPIDVTGIGGYRGFCAFARMCAGLPVRIFQTMPGGIPVDPGLSNCRTLSPAEQASAAKLPGVVGLGEVFSWTKVVSRDPATMGTLRRMLEAGCVINGHTAGMSGAKLNAYAASGIMSCHEPIDAEQALERLRLGMWVMIREGSIRRDLEAILGGLESRGISRDRLMFCSDGVDPVDMEKYGYIDYCVREAVRLGVPRAGALAMASRNAFDYYGMGGDLGGIAPGRLADIVLFDKSMRPETVLVGGRVAAHGGRVVAPFPRRPVPAWLKRTVRLGRFSPADFAVPADGDEVEANTIMLQTEIVTRRGAAGLAARRGRVELSGGVCKVASFDRIGRTGRRAVGFLEGLGADVGAFASTWCFHEGDMIVIGTDDSDMALAANRLVSMQGGMAVADSGRIAASMPLQMAGVASTRPFGRVAADLAGITGALAAAGCPFERPHLIPLFLPFLALPSVRILSSGIVDVKSRSYIPPYA